MNIKYWKKKKCKKSSLTESVQKVKTLAAISNEDLKSFLVKSLHSYKRDVKEVDIQVFSEVSFFLSKNKLAFNEHLLKNVLILSNCYLKL